MLKQTSKLAAEAEIGDELIRLFSEAEDSGIDSDDASRRRAERQSDGSSSDDDNMSRPWWQNARNEPPKAVKRCQLSINIGAWPNKNPDLDRSSPPLYEVELTASDEEDDASVLELVIPMSSSRYKRVPVSSPKKAKPKSHRFLRMFCCLLKK